MDKSELAETGRALIALSEGEKVEWKTWANEWVPCGAINIDGAHVDGKLRPHRIKHQPVKRLLRQDELPPVFWVRFKGDPTVWHLVRAVSYDSVWVNDQRYILGTTALLEYSTDRKTSHSFWTEQP